MEEQYGFWSHKYDFAEINKYNWRLVLKDSYKLDIKKIAFISLLLAFEIVLTIINKYTFGLLLIMNTYTIEMSFFGIMFAYISTNLTYASIICIVSNSIRIVVPGGSDWVGVLAMTLADITFLIVFSITFFFLKKYWLLKVKSENKIKYYLGIVIISGILSIFLTGVFTMSYNDIFVFDLYILIYPDYEKILKESWLLFLLVGFGVTLIKYILNLIFLAVSLKILVKLINKHLF
ncbi:ECF transporter S component [Spiroplasma monobiae]|uniref:Uncharacterized protein n=1 Tax=Spiroplasma monobiae MQ-1 TaxID=1336748 RepID=A0A2K9LTT8_SPISQ|nr:ECF transporter S component [Spiroplasma monobiae]AUM62488.1 hypothetical protein SMONO_v1c02370 [Spiroplasma monobiae MQ-1]